MLIERQVDLPPQNPPWRTRKLKSKPLKAKALLTFTPKVHLPMRTALLDFKIRKALVEKPPIPSSFLHLLIRGA